MRQKRHDIDYSLPPSPAVQRPSPAAQEHPRTLRAKASVPPGSRQGKLVAIDVVRWDDGGRLKQAFLHVLARCDCGKVFHTILYAWQKGITQSCGCTKRAADIKGQVFGRLTVLGRGRPDPKHAYL